MALRKHNFDDHDEQDTSMGEKSHLVLDINPKLLQNIEKLAEQQNLSVHEYLELILEQVASKKVEVRQEKPVTREMLEALRQLQDELMRERNGKFFDDSVELIHQMREERSQELENL